MTGRGPSRRTALLTVLIALAIGAVAPLTSAAATGTGQLYAFGLNRYGQLGIEANSGTGNPNPTPALVSLSGASVAGVAANWHHSLALTSTGQLFAFGLNSFGQLGSPTNNGTEEPNPTPTPVTLPGASGPVTQIAAGEDHSLALTSTGQLYAFGANREGQLGNATNNETYSPNPTPTPVTLPGASGMVTQIAASVQSLALTSTGRLYAFGNNQFGQLGSPTNNGTEKPNPTPTPVELGSGTKIDTMASGSTAYHTLVVIPTLTVTSESLPGGRVGAPYRATAKAEGGISPYSWQVSGLPDGLSIDVTSGQISGTPTAAGTARVQLSVSDKFGIVAKGALLALSIGSAPIETSPPTEAARLKISMLRQSHRRWREGRGFARISSLAAPRKGRRVPLGTTFLFGLNRRARVRFMFVQRNGKRFRRAMALSFAGHRGMNRVRFQGRISRHRRLKPGRYKMTAIARSGGVRSKPRSVSFTIVR